MNEFAIAIFGILLVLVVLQIFPAVAFLRSLNSKNRQKEELPLAAIVLCVRGADPFLADCIDALLHQNYPQYSLRIVIDSLEDPAWSVVNQAIERSGATNVQVSPLRDRSKTGSLKGSALVQAISALDDSYKAVALIDSDVIAHPDWLRELVIPLADEQIGATTGNRWFIPQNSQWGTLIRYVWNSPAVVFMFIQQALWGGSMALKLSVLREAGLLETWKRSVSTDASILQAIRAKNLQVKFVPTVMMLNRESCDFGGCLRYMTRQLLVTRLYLSQWSLIVLHTFLTNLALALAGVFVIVAGIEGNSTATSWLASGLLGYILAMAVMLICLDLSIRKVVKARGEVMNSFSALMIVKGLIAIPLTQLISAIAVVRAVLTRSIDWRGISYQIKGPWEIKLTEYHPYQPPNKSVDTKASI